MSQKDSKKKRRRARVSELVLAGKNLEEELEDEELEDEETEDDIEIVEDEGPIKLSLSPEVEEPAPQQEIQPVVVTEATLVNRPQDKTLGSLFLERLMQKNPSVVNRVVADLMLTEFSEVADDLRQWYTKLPNNSLYNYGEAKSSVFKYLTENYDQLDKDRLFANYITEWFVNVMGFRN